MNKSKYVLWLIQTTNPQPENALLETISPIQSQAIIEIAYNILRIPLSIKLKEKIKKKTKSCK